MNTPTQQQARALSDAPPLPEVPSFTPEERAIRTITNALDTVMMEAFGGQSISGQRFIANQLRAALEFLGNDAVNRITQGVVNHYGRT